MKDLDCMRDALKALKYKFAHASTEAEKNSLALSYKDLQDKIAYTLNSINHCD